MSRRSSLTRPSPLSGKPPAIDYSARPHLGGAASSSSSSSSSSDHNHTTTDAASSAVAASSSSSSSFREEEAIIDMNDYRPGAAATARTNWNVEDAALRPLPPLHPPLDPQSTAFVCDASPSVIAARVSECLRRQSIMSEFDDDSASVSAMTANRVRFMIRLYRGGGANNSSFAHGVIVEVQRLRGDPITFHQASRAILSSAQGDASGGQTFYNPNVPNHGMGLALDIPISASAAYAVTTADDDSKTNSDDFSSILMALEIDWSLIKKDRMDANILGWESLAMLTNATSSGRATATVAARVVLGLSPRGVANEEEDERFSEIHASIISLIRDNRMIGANDTNMTEAAAAAAADTVNQEGKNDADYLDDNEMQAATAMIPHPEDTEHLIIQRSLAIRSLANALEVLSNESDIHFMEHAVPNLVLNEDLIPSLLDEVSLSVLPNNPFNASDATHAMRALRVFFEHSPDARNIAHARNARGILSKARLVGRSRHAALEMEAERAFQALGTEQEARAAAAASSSSSSSR